MCLAEEQQIVYISRFYSIAALCITFTDMCLLSFETSSLLFYCFRFYFLLMMDIAKSETFKNFIILNKALLFLIKLSKTAVQSLKLFTSQKRPMTSLKLSISQKIFRFWKAISENLKNWEKFCYLSTVLVPKLWYESNFSHSRIYAQAFL